jgi:CBS domain-containing protein
MDQSVGNVCSRNVVTVTPTTSVAEAAALMRKNHVGTVVIVDERAGARIPTGILTDRDIVVEVVAAGLDAKALNVAEVVQRPLATITSQASSSQVVREMSVQGVRRMPVVNPDGTLAGIVSLDDVLLDLITPLVAVGDLGGRERRFEANTRST